MCCTWATSKWTEIPGTTTLWEWHYGVGSGLSERGCHLYENEPECDKNNLKCLKKLNSYYNGSSDHYFSVNPTKIWTVYYSFESHETGVCFLLKLLFYFYSNSSVERYLLQSKTAHLIFRNLWLFTQCRIFKPFQAATYIYMRCN